MRTGVGCGALLVLSPLSASGLCGRLIRTQAQKVAAKGQTTEHMREQTRLIQSALSFCTRPFNACSYASYARRPHRTKRTTSISGCDRR